MKAQVSIFAEKCRVFDFPLCDVYVLKCNFVNYWPLFVKMQSINIENETETQKQKQIYK